MNQNDMKIVFVSNYYNHHQSAFSEAMSEKTGGEYVFIETSPMESERVAQGWTRQELPAFVRQSYTDKAQYAECLRLINRADVVIYGNAPYEMIADRLKSGRLVFLYSERWYKQSFDWKKWPVRVVRHHRRYGQYRHFYLLCAGAYVAKDCAKTFLFHNKAYKWGYFPQTKVYSDTDLLLSRKDSHSILWTARMIPLKHPEIPVRIAQRLVSEGCSFTLTMIGGGELATRIKDEIQRLQLSDYVRVLDAMSPEEVREQMEKSEIFLFTSDRNEGWGAVLNESMNAGCAVIAGSAVGSVPYLIRDGENGMTYADEEQLYQKVKLLLNDSRLRNALGREAYKTITGEWNARTAAERLLCLSEQLLSGSHPAELYASGPCSQA